MKIRIQSLQAQLPMVSLLLLLACANPLNPVKKTDRVEIGPGWSRTMVNATIFRYNSVVSHDGWQYVAYYDSVSNVTLAKRKSGSDEWIVKTTQYKGNALDAHNVITIMVDGQGYLHMAWDHHNNPLNYCQSIEPGSLELSDRKSMIGKDEERVTYSEFYRLPSGNMIFVYRDGGSGNGNMVMNRYDIATKKWSRLHDNLIDGEGARNAYWQLYISRSGAIHLSWVWRETYNVETNHDMCYAISRDSGKTWTKSGGEKYAIPIREATAEYAWRIPQGSDLINQTSITADEQDVPYIATYFQDQTDTCPQYYVIYKPGETWKLSRASTRTTNFDLGGMGSRSIPMSRPQLIYGYSKGEKNIMLLYRDDEYNGTVRMAYASLPDLKWSAIDLTDYPLERWEPSYDTELWKEKNQLHIFLQKVGQESGEKPVAMDPQPVSILEVSLK